jgi:endonuclease V-like protein UPF0215 family
VNVIGFDDGPFARDHKGDVLLVGVVCSGTRVDGIVSGRIRRDGANATQAMVDLVRRSQFGTHLQAVMLQGIAVGGFNVVDVQGLHAALRLPVLVVTRKRPDLDAVKRALFADVPHQRPRVRGAARKWRLIEGAGPMERLGPSNRAIRRARPTGLAAQGPNLWVQRVGLTLDEARRLVERTTLHGNVPEPLRLAHLIAGGITEGKSRGRA